MAQLPVEFHSDAAAELERAYDWYSERSIVAARAFLKEVVEAVEDLSSTHATWPVFHGKYQRRVLPRFPFSVIYRVRENTVQVLAVAHEKKRPDYWTDRV